MKGEADSKGKHASEKPHALVISVVEWEEGKRRERNCVYVCLGKMGKLSHRTRLTHYSLFLILILLCKSGNTFEFFKIQINNRFIQ